MWGNVWFIVKTDLKRTRWGIVISVLLYLYFCFFGSFTFDDLLASDPAKMNGIAADLIFLTSMGCMGFMMTREYNRYWLSDVFSRRVQFLRQLPISIREMVWARYLHMGINLVMLGLVYYVPLYFLSEIGSRLSLTQYISFALLWACFGACSAVVYAYKEMGSSGKSYFWFCTLTAVGYIAASIAVWLLGKSFTLMSVSLVERFGPLVPLAAASIAVIWIKLWSAVTERKIRNREFFR